MHGTYLNPECDLVTNNTASYFKFTLTILLLGSFPIPVSIKSVTWAKTQLAHAHTPHTRTHTHVSLFFTCRIRICKLSNFNVKPTLANIKCTKSTELMGCITDSNHQSNSSNPWPSCLITLVEYNSPQHTAQVSRCVQSGQNSTSRGCDNSHHRLCGPRQCYRFGSSRMSPRQWFI